MTARQPSKTEDAPGADPAFDSLTAALAWVQANLPHVGKGSTNPAFKTRYADLADVSTAVLPLTGRAGLAWTCVPTYRDDRYVLVGTMTHTSGGTIEALWPLGTGTAQAIGSQITYGRRYMLTSIVGVAADEDDDGNAARTVSHDRPRQQAPETRPAAPPPPAPPAPEPERAPDVGGFVIALADAAETSVDAVRAMPPTLWTRFAVRPDTEVPDPETGEVVAAAALIMRTVERAAERQQQPKGSVTRLRAGDPDDQAAQWQTDTEQQGVLA